MFEKTTQHLHVPLLLNNPFKVKPSDLCLIAASQLQDMLTHQQIWVHNFGLNPAMDGPIIGKMFGVLVVKNTKGELGYLSAFSGKMAGVFHLPGFVPPVYDYLHENSFLNIGMQKLNLMNARIKELNVSSNTKNEALILDLKTSRKTLSASLQQEIFDNHVFTNSRGEQASMMGIFELEGYKNPPAGAGECAAPKLFQYAFLNNYTPIAISEFWWGVSPKSDHWKHKEFYPACNEKCKPILGYMLQNIPLE